MIKRRVKSVTAPCLRKKKKIHTPESKKKAVAAKKRYLKNRSKLLKAAKLRRSHLTTAEKLFNKKRAEFLRKHKHTH